MSARRKRRKLPKVSKIGRQWSYRYTDETGRQRRASFATEAEALAHVNDTYMKLNRGDDVAPVSATLKEVSDAYLNDLKASDVSVGWAHEVAALLDNHINPALGQYPVAQLAEWPLTGGNLIEAFLRRKAGTSRGDMPPTSGRPGVSSGVLSAQTVRHLRGVLLRIFEKVENDTDGRIRNPVKRIKQQKLSVDEVTPLTPADVRDLLALFEEEFQTAVLIMVAVGARLSEVFGILLEDHEPERAESSGEGWLYIRRALTLGDQEAGEDRVVIGPTKVDGSRGKYRYPITAELNARIKRHVALTADRDNPRRLLFANANGGFVHWSNFNRRHWQPAVVSLALKRLDAQTVERVCDELPQREALLARVIAASDRLALRGALDLRWADLDDDVLHYRDTCGVAVEQPLPDDVAWALAAWRSAQIECGRPNKDDLIFLGDGNRSRRVSLPDALRPLRQRLAQLELLPHITPHTLRHTYASTLIDLGMHQDSVSRLLRHTKTSYTWERYVHRFEAQDCAPVDTGALYIDSA